jgi:iron(III) transport system ATP-binding protein
MTRSISLPAGDSLAPGTTEDGVIVSGLVKTFEDGGRKGGERVKAVDNVSFRIERGTMFTLLGPSGCGKTTTLRCIAGLEKPDQGTIVVDGQIFTSTEGGVDLPVHRRGLGMVFQSYAIWPHLSVLQNVAFPLMAIPRKRRPSKRKIHERVERILDVVQLGELENRPATDLSGGQQQRLALARALVTEPPLLLLDEPLSNLDANLREEMRFELKRLQRELGVTSVYVTHDQIEALSMSKNVAVMNEGQIEQIGRPREIYDKPASRFVAGFIGISNLFRGIVVDRSSVETHWVKTDLGMLHVAAQGTMARGTEVLVVVRPEQIELDLLVEDVTEWVGNVRARAFVGDAVEHVIRMPGGIDVRVKSSPTTSIPPGTAVRLRFPEGCTVVPNI